MNYSEQTLSRRSSVGRLPAVGALILLCSGLLLSPATADDHHRNRDWDKKQRNHSQRYYYSNGYNNRPSVSFGFMVPTRTYYATSQNYSSRSIEIDVQRALSRRGYYRGPIDGDIGPGSRAGIRAFQGDNGLVPTGRIDRGLLYALR